MTEQRNAILAEIEEIARQAGAEHVAKHRPIIDQYEGRLPEDVNAAIERSNTAFFNRCVTSMRETGAKSGARKVYMRGLHAGMKQGTSALFLPYLEAKGSA